MATLKQALVKLILLLITGYRYLLSPLLGPRCRFEPSCSEYASESLKAHGLALGSYFFLCRICRCHPFAKGGYDPVPKKDVR